jgi:hypothetical protein
MSTCLAYIRCISLSLSALIAIHSCLQPPITLRACISLSSR